MRFNMRRMKGTACFKFTIAHLPNIRQLLNNRDVNDVKFIKFCS